MTKEATRNLLLFVIATILTLWAFRAAATVVVPVILSVFVALLVAPIERKVRERMPEKLGWVGLLVAIGAIIAGLAAFVGAIWLSATQVSDALTGVQEQIDRMLDDGSGITVFGKSLAQLSAMVSERAVGEMGKVAKSVLESSSVILSGLIIVIFMVALMLAERGRAAKAASHLLGEGEKETLDDTIATAAKKMRTYLFVRLMLGVITALVYTAWLAIFGLDLLLVWGILTVLLSFIPNLGSIVSGSLPVLYALITKDPFQVALMAAGLFVIEQVIGNFIDPRIQGKQISLSPVVVLLGLLLWGWVFGVVGTLLATPISIAIVVAGAHLRWGEGVALMLSNATTIAELRETATGEAEAA